MIAAFGQQNPVSQESIPPQGAWHGKGSFAWTTDFINSFVSGDQN